MPTDVARLFQVAAGGGHAGPGSSWDYIHCIEEALTQWSRKARPSSWNPVEPHALDAVLFPDIVDAVLLDARTTPPPRAKSARDSSERGRVGHTLALRHEITRRIARGETIDEVAGHCSIEPTDVLDWVRAISLVLVDAGLVEEDAVTTPSRQIDEIWHRRTWVAASCHEKLAPVLKGIDLLLVDERVEAAREIWNAWLRCQDGKDLRLDRSRPASVLLRFLVKAGVPRRSLAVTAPQQALPLPRHLAEQKLTWRRCQERPGVSKYRLALVPAHVTASRGKARQVSVVGLHWLILLCGAAILAQEK